MEGGLRGEVKADVGVLCIGDKNAMGIFIWATDSDINFKVKGVPIVELSSANVSVMDAVDIGQTS